MTTLTNFAIASVLNKDFVSFKDSHCPFNFLKIFDIAFSLILSTRCVESDTHILNAFIKVLFPLFQVFEYTVLLLLGDSSRIVGASLIHHNLVLCSLIFLLFLLSVALQIGWDFAFVFLPCIRLGFLPGKVCIDRLHVLLGVFHDHLILSNVILPIAADVSVLLSTLNLSAFEVSFSVLEAMRCNFGRYFSELFHFEWNFGIYT